MASLITATTPSPSSDIHTPPTPRHGYADSWEPYSPRKSARLSQRANNHRTPSPRSTRHSDRNPFLGSPRSTKTTKKNNLPATLTSPATSPRKKRVAAAMDSVRRASGTLTAEGTANAAAALGLPSGMLPTPAKTPQKPPTEQNKANIKAVARTLFRHEDEVMPSPRKTRSKQHHVLDSFENVVEEDIPIYTDSHERIPEVDASSENPFYGKDTVGGTVPEPGTRRSTRSQHVRVPGEGKITIDEAVRRNDGMLIVFRGKKKFRKFSEVEEASSGNEVLDEADGGLNTALRNAVDSAVRRPVTRSSIKPRLLFPTKPAEASDTKNDDEEAVTDIEDHVLAKSKADHPETPLELVEEAPDTPVAPKFAPASPPTTARTTRHGDKGSEESTPIKPTRSGKRSPFDGWRRVKNGSESQSQKRSGDTLTADAPKRTRA